METLEVKILRPEAVGKLDELANQNLIEISGSRHNGKQPLKFGCMKGLVEYIADDFDAPLEDFEEYT